MTAKGVYFPQMAEYVPNMTYAADVSCGGEGQVEWSAPVAGVNDNALTLFPLKATGRNFFTADQEGVIFKAMFGRTIKVTSTFTTAINIWGKDYLGQSMVETITTGGSSKKAFKSVIRAAPVTGAFTNTDTLTIVGNDVFGLPYKMIKLNSEVVDNAIAATAGTVVIGVDVQTLTSGDPRGTYAPAAANVPNGVRNYRLTALWEDKNLHGVRHVTA